MQLFGTDGIRAPYGTYPLDPETIVHLGYCLGSEFATRQSSPSVVLGGDTRSSTEEICGWLAAGLSSTGTKPIYGGVLPTPAIAHLAVDLHADAGVSVSASHNLHPDNGIKLFDNAGFKWSPMAERRLEKRMRETRADLPLEPEPLEVDSSLAESYLEALRSRVASPEPLRGLKLVLDTANGAAAPYATTLFQDLGAEVVTLGDRPNGTNINAGCGSTAPQAISAAVREHSAHFGIAFDGDADRALLTDESGQTRDGDAMLYLWARHLLSRGFLTRDSIVATSMSNLGLERALASDGISVIRCDVGDRHVVDTMRENNVDLGGEQSGHVVYLPVATTGDGLSTGLQLASIIAQDGRSLSDLLTGFERFPQVLVNVRVRRKPPLDSLPSVVETARKVKEELGAAGRLVLRYSGTEPLARVMIEGQDQAEIQLLADLLIGAIADEIGEDDNSGR